MAVRSALVNVMIKAAEKAGRALTRDFGEVENLQVSRKGPADFVSTADRKSESILHDMLAKARPEFGFLMEESGAIEGAKGGGRWIVDPLDGTTNFLHGLPHWAISIAAEQDGEIVAAVVADPLADEVYWADKGAGAFVNGRRIRVSARQRLEDSLIATGAPFKGHGDVGAFSRDVSEILKHTAGIRRFGAAALDLAYVASGRFDAFWEDGLHPWDVAAGYLLVVEAGGFVTQIDGGRDPVATGSVLAANSALFRPVGDLLRSARGLKGSVAPMG